MSVLDVLLAGVKPDPAFDAWYRKFAGFNGLDPNPDDPQHHYDYRGAFHAGAMPVIEGDGFLHLPSEFKDKDHPNRFVMIGGQLVDTITGRPVR